MRRIALTAVLAAALAPSAAASSPRIVVATSSPLVVTGTHFVAHEKVTVSYGTNARQVSATGTGSFSVTFAGVVLDRCSAYRVAAVGARGDRAVVTQARRMCIPASNP